MKSYTDLKQSKKLLELGIDINTADMYYINSNTITIGKWEDDTHDEDDLPCWSLTALMNFIESLGKVEINFNCSSNKYWVNVHFESIGSFCQDHELYDSKIDALIAIIEKLKSRNLL